ncbi:glycosyltransferase family 39 protein [Patescibacteria group bacterium]|nr:glycosyltransferase family 39 protein [Patescibacteria group bacterium]
MNNKTTNLLAVGLLVLMLGLAFFSIKDRANTMDELAHTPAGYSYIIKKDMRLNPEHPPLLKDLAGLSILIGSKITKTLIYFPDQVKSWQEDLNGQWDFGREFLFRNNNDADKIIFFARLPMLLIMLVLGWYVFRWAREIYGNKAGLLALFLYSLSPTFLAHGRLVTTDVGAAAAFFISIYYLVKWLEKPNRKNMVIAGLVFGLALLTKFSLVLLIPYFIFIVFVWALINNPLKNPWFYRLLKAGIGLLLIGLIGMALIWPVYQFHTWNYPVEKQLADAQANLKTYGGRWLADPVIWMSDKPILRPYGQFFTGLLMVIQRSAGGNTTYFLGEISNQAWSYYFPTVFLIKVPLAFLILILLAISRLNIKTDSQNKALVKLTKFSLISFFILFWFVSVRSNLNIGIRHILPTFPILYVLISGQIAKVLEKDKKFIKILVIILLLWYGLGTINAYPNFISYFNELIGGSSQGYKYVTDSNLDWGQDLKQLAQFIEENNIEMIYIDYFGGDDLNYRFGDKYQPWWGDRNPNELPSNGWLAVSTTLLQGGRGKTVHGYNEKTDYYNWLNQYEPVEIINNSIFIYQIKVRP